MQTKERSAQQIPVSRGEHDPKNLTESVRSLAIGKRVGGALYVHRDALERHDADLFALACSCAAAAGAAFPWNVCKLAPYRQQVSLLHYPRFREDEHPALETAASVDLTDGTARIRRYAPNGNRPILHRKELLLDASDADYARFAALTDQEEQAGLFSKPNTIGHERGWTTQLERRGVTIRDHRLIAAGG